MKIIILSVLTLIFSSCDSGSTGNESKTTSFEAAIEAETGHQWSVYKVSTKQGYYSIFRDDTTGTYHAFNMAKWNGGSYASFEASLLPGDHISGLTKTLETGTNSDGTTWSEDIYTYGGLRFENAGSAFKDLEMVATLRDEAAKAYLTHRFQSEFSLSTARAEELAKMTTRYQRLESRRALTSSEKNVFAMNALGVSMTQVERAMKLKAQGDETEYDDMLETAARVNRTTPEQVGKFFEDMAGSL